MHAHRPTSAVACLTAAGRRLGAAVVFAAIAALALLAAPPAAEAQTAGTVTLAVTSSSGGNSGTSGSIAITEGETFTITVTAHGITAGQVIGNLAITLGSASASDVNSISTASGYVIPSSGSVNYATRTIVDDSIAEGDETFTVSISGSVDGISSTPATWSIGTPSSVTITIAANDGNIFSIAAGAASVAEDVGNITFTVTFTITVDALSNGLSSVDWTVGGTGITAGDVDSLSGMLVFTNVGQRTITLAVTDDSDLEEDETLTVTLSNPSVGNVITSATASTIILGNDGNAFTITANAATATESDGNITFTVRLIGEALSSGSRTVDWAVGGPSITAGDVEVTSGTLAFTSTGAQTLPIAITDDSIGEGAETLTVTLSNPTGGATIATAAASTTIAANDAAFSIAVDQAARAEGQTAVFTVTFLGSAPPGGATVDWAVSGAGITAADYTLSGAGSGSDGTLSFPAPGRQFLTFAITDDSAREGPETLAVTLSNPGSGSLTTATAATTIAASDQGRISLSIVSSGGDRDATAPGRQVNEGDLITWIISARPASRSGAVAITVNFGGAYASGDSDFNPVTGHSVGIPLDTGNTRVRQRITNDSDIEDAETIIVTVASAPPGWELPSAPAIVTILPSDGTEWYIDSPPAGAVAEGATLNIVLRQRGLPRQFSTDVSYAVTGSATVSADYAVQDDVPNLPGEFDPATRTHTITAWNHIHHVVIPIRILLDRGADAGETITVALTSGGGLATFDATPRTFTITDTEAAPLRLTGPASVTEAHRDLRYTVSYTPDRLVPAVSIPFTVTGSATRGPGGTSSPLRLPGGRAGQTLSADIIVPLAEGDATVTAEGAETVTVTPAFTLATADYGLNPAPASVTTQVTDAAATVYLDAAASPRAVAEGETVTVFVGHRGPGRSAATTATFTFSGSAAYGSDYEVTARTEAPTLAFDATAATGSVQIPTGALARGEIDLRILSDNIADEPETIVITLTGHTGAAADSPRAFDATPLTLTITPAAVSVAATAPAGDRDTDSDALDVNEGDTVNFAVTVAGAIPPNADGSPGALEVDWAVTGVESADWSTTASRAGDGGALTFTAAGSQTVAVTVAADNLNEAAETLRFTLTRAGALGAFGERAAEARIAASDPAVYSIAADTGTATEGGAAAFTVTLTKASEAAVTIPLVASGAAAARVVAPPAAVTIPAGRTTAAVSIPIADNDLNQAPQNLRLVVAPESHADFAKGAAAGAVTRTITLDDGRRADVSVADNDPAAVTLAQASADGDPITAGVQVAEGAAAAFTVTLSPASAGQVTVPYTITGADITADDYADPGSGSLILAAGETTATIAIGIALDGAPEAVETMTVTIGSPTAGSGGGTVALGAAAQRSAAVQIPANGAAAQAVFFAPVSGGAAIAENDADGETFTITRSGPDLTAGLTVFWDITHVTTAAADLSAATRAGGQVTFSGDQASKTITVTAADDRVPEGDKEFKLELSATASQLQSHGGVALGAPLRVLLADNEAVWVEAAPGAPTAAEGAPFRVALRQIAAVDSAGRATVALADIPLRYRLGADGNPATEDVGAAEFRDHGGYNPSVFDPFPAGDGAIALDADSPRPWVWLSTAADDLNEADKALTLLFRAAPGLAPRVRVGPAVDSSAEFALDAGYVDEYALTVTITDDDPITATFAPASRRMQVDEGMAVQLAVNFDRASAGDVTVTYTVTAGGDLPPAFSDLTGGSITVPAGETSGIIRLQTALSAERTATAGLLTVAFGTITSDARGGQVSGSGEAVISVRYLQQARTIAITPVAASVEEGGMARFSIALNGAPPAAPVTVDWTVAAGAAANPAAAADLTGATSGTFTFTAAAHAPQAIAIAVADDALNEAAETVRVALSLPGASAAATRLHADHAAAAVTIAASDPLTYRLSGDRALESGGEAVFTVHLSRRSAGAVTIPIASTTSGTATPSVDWSADISSVTVPAGALRASFSAALTDDNLNESDETIIASITAAATPGPRAGAVALAENGGTATAVIVDDDPVTVSVTPPDPAAAVEGGSAEFTVTLGGGEPTRPLRVFYAIGGADITAADYYDPAGGVVEFSLAQATADPAEAMFTVVIIADAAAEVEETLTVTVTGGASVAGAVAPAAGRAAAGVVIAANDAAAHQFRFDGPPGRIAEGDAAVFAVSRTGPAIDGELTVNWAYTAGSAAAADFSGGAPPGGTLTFSGSQRRAAFTIQTAGDNLNEADETFSLVLSATPETRAAGVAVAGAPVEVAIADDDVLIVTSRSAFSCPPDFVSDSRSAIPLWLGLGGAAATAPVEVTWTFGGDYTPGTFTADSGSHTFAVGDDTVLLQDAVRITPPGPVYLSRSIILMLSAQSAGAVRVGFEDGACGTWNLVPHSIAELTVTADSPAVNEGGVAVFTVANDEIIPADSRLAITADYTLTAGGGIPPAFADRGDGVVTIPAGRRSVQIRVDLPLSATDSGSGSLTVTLRNQRLAGGTLGISTRAIAPATVTVNYTAQPEFAAAHPGAPRAWHFTEGRAYDFPVTLSAAAPPGETYSVRWAVQTDDAPASGGAQLFSAAPADFCDAAGAPLARLPGGMLRFAGAVQRQTVTLRFCADGVLEPTEEFRLTLSEPGPVNAVRIAGGEGSRQSLHLRVDSAETPGVEVPERLEVSEGGSANLTVTFSGGALPPGAYLIVTPAALAGVAALSAAERPAAFARAGAVIPAAANPLVIPLVFPDDTANEAEEGAQFTLAFGGMAQLPAQTVAIRVADNDPLRVTIAAPSPATVNEGETAEFTVTVAGGAPGADLTVDYSLSGAAEAADYRDPGGGSLTIPAGEVSGRIAVHPAADRAAEAAEDLTVTLDSVAGGGGGTVQLGDAAATAATATIAASTTAAHAFRLSVSAARITEGGGAQFTVTRSGAALGATDQITLNWALAHGGSPAARATDATDFTGATSGQVVFNTANPATRQFTVSTQGVEAVLEGDEAFTVTLSASPSTLSGFGGVQLDAAAMVVTVADNSPNHMRLGLDPLTGTQISEGTELALTVELLPIGNEYVGRTLSAGFPLRIAYTALVRYRGSQTSPLGPHLPDVFDDYPVNGIVVIPPGSDRAATTLRIVDNRLNEPFRQLLLHFRHADAGAAGAPLALWGTNPSARSDLYELEFNISDNDPLTAAFADTSVVQAVEGGAVALPVRLNGAAAGSVYLANIPYAVTSVAGVAGVAPLWEDPGGGVLQIQPGDTTGVIHLELPAGPADSGDGSIRVTLGTPQLATPPARSASLPSGQFGRGLDAVAAADSTPAQIRVRYLPAAAPRLFRLAAATSDAVAEGGMARFTVSLAGAPPTPAAPAAVNWRLVSEPTTISVTPTAGQTELLLAQFGLPPVLLVTRTAGQFVDVFSQEALVPATAADVTAAAGRLVFTAAAPQTFSVAVADDTLNESAETLSIVLDAPAAAGIDAGNAAAAATIAASDPVTVTLSGGGVVAEDAGAARFTVTLSGPSAGGISVPLAFGGSASAGSGGIGADFTAPAAVAIPAGVVRAQFEVDIVEDSANEAREDLTVTLGPAISPAAGAGPASRAAAAADYAATLEITDNDAYLVTISPPDPAAVNEGETAVFSVAVSGALLPPGGIAVPYTIGGDVSLEVRGTPDDYADPGGGMLRAAAATPLSLAILADGAPEGAEELTVTLGAPTGIPGAATVTRAAAAVTIAANTVDATRTISLTGPATLTEGGGAQTYTLNASSGFSDTVTPSGDRLTITWRIVHGGTTDADFAAVTGEVIFPATSFTITAADDSIAEGAESFAIAISLNDLAFEGGTKLAAPLAAAIAASDPLSATVAVSGDGTVSEGGAAVVNLAISGASTGLIVTWTIAPGATSPIEPGDIGGGMRGGPLRIAAGAAGASFRIPIADDELHEGVENFSVTVAAATPDGAPVTVTGGTRAFAIAVSDPVTASFAATALSATAGEEVTLTVLLDRMADAATESRFSVAGPVNAVTASPITIPAGATSADIIVRAIPDPARRAMADATVTLQTLLSGGAGARRGAVGGPAVIRVAYREPSHLFSIALAPGGEATVDEGESLNFIIRLAGPAVDETLSVRWLAQGAAESGITTADFSGLFYGTAAFAPGAARTQTVTVTIADDAVNETSERFTVVLAGPAGAAAAVDPGKGSAAAVITPSDPVTYAFAPGSGGSVAEGAGSVVLVVQLSAPVQGSTVTIPVNATAIGLEAADYRVPAQVVFAAGATSANLSVAIVDDNINEADGRLELQLSTFNTVTGDRPRPRLAAGIGRAALTVTDNDPVQIGFTGTTAGRIFETGGAASAIRRLSLTGAPVRSAPVYVDFTISGSGITIGDLSITASGAHVGQLSGRAVFPVGSYLADIVLTARRDNIFELDETAAITLTGASSAGAAVLRAGETAATVVIEGRDMAGDDWVDVAKKTADEIREPGIVGDRLDVVFSITVSDTPLALLGRTYTWRIIGTGANPTDADDFAAVTGSVFIAQGAGRDDMDRAVPHDFTVTVLSDNVIEGHETFLLRLDPADRMPLRNDYAGTIIGPLVSGYRISFGTRFLDAAGNEVGHGRLDEGGTYRAAITASIINELVDITFRYNFASHTTGGVAASSASDRPANGSWILAAGQTSGEFTFTVPQDSEVERTEGLSVGITSSSPGNPISFTQNYTLQIHDNDLAVVSAPLAVAAVEGDSVAVPVRVNPAVPAALTAHYTLTLATDAGDVPIAFTDQTATSTLGQLTIPANAATADIRVFFPVTTLSRGRGRVIVNLTRLDLPAWLGQFGSSNARVFLSGQQSEITVDLRDVDYRFSISGPAAAAAEGGSAEFTVTMDGPTPPAGNPARVNWRLDFSGAGPANGVAAAADVTGATGGMLSFADGMPQTVAIAIADDALNEGTETLTARIAVSAPASGGGQGSGVEIAAATAAIAPSDPVAFGIAADRTAISEGGSHSVTLTLSRAGGLPPGAASVFAGLSFSGAATDGDFALSPSARAFAFNTAGDDLAVTLTAVDDDLNEPAEALTVTIDTAASAAPGAISADPPPGGSHSVTLTIGDNDPLNPSFTPAAQTVAEGDAAALTLQLAARASVAEEFTIAVTGTGIAPGDYRGPAAVTVAPGAGSAPLSFDIVYDGAAEVAETMTITATRAANAADSASAAVTIPQNALAIRAVTVTGPAAVAEAVVAAGAAAEFTATLDTPFTEDTAAVWRIIHADTTAADFTADSGAFTFAANDASATFTVRTARDRLNEGAEAFTVEAGAADRTASGGTAPGAMAGEITDAADDAVRVTIVPGA
ncbi:MAG: hypothetical protein OXU94_02475, partial [Gammaproteobacteria bacterium]|nr:hypothetical protein [Gammaproteobacteria bacterium]